MFQLAENYNRKKKQNKKQNKNQKSPFFLYFFPIFPLQMIIEYKG